MRALIAPCLFQVHGTIDAAELPHQLGLGIGLRSVVPEGFTRHLLTGQVERLEQPLPNAARTRVWQHLHPQVTPSLPPRRLHLVGCIHCTHKMTMPTNRHIQISTGGGRPAETPFTTPQRHRGQDEQRTARRLNEAGKKSSAAGGLVCPSCRCPALAPVARPRAPRCSQSPVFVACASRSITSQGADIGGADVRAQSVFASAVPNIHFGGFTNADQAAVHDSWEIALREDSVPPRHLRDQEP
jgi:hypothetical protein